MNFIRVHTLTSASLAIALICIILPFDSLATFFLGSALASFLFEAGKANGLAYKIRQLLKL